MLSSLLRFLFPQQCRKCGRPGNVLCTGCINRIPFACSLPRDRYAVFEYGNALVQSAIRELKYHRRSEFARALAQAALPHIAEYIADTLQSSNPQQLILVPIPEHQKTIHNRGFNQSTLLAKQWSASFAGSTVASLLQKVIITAPQARLNRVARMKNVAQSMQCSKQIDGQAVYMVVDDVTTTGATFTEACRALSDAGAVKIFCIALAHGYVRK